MNWLLGIFRRRHRRNAGPVPINPEVPEIVQAWGGPEYSWLDRMDGLK